jgi:hypothetical protein
MLGWKRLRPRVFLGMQTGGTELITLVSCVRRVGCAIVDRLSAISLPLVQLANPKSLSAVRLIGPSTTVLPENLVLPIVARWAYYPIRVRFRAQSAPAPEQEAKLQLPGHPSAPFRSVIGHFFLFKKHLSHR